MRPFFVTTAGAAACSFRSCKCNEGGALLALAGPETTRRHVSSALPEIKPTSMMCFLPRCPKSNGNG